MGYCRNNRRPSKLAFVNRLISKSSSVSIISQEQQENSLTILRRPALLFLRNWSWTKNKWCLAGTKNVETN